MGLHTPLFGEHHARIYHGYTVSRLPVELVFSQEFSGVRDAIIIVSDGQSLSKEALISGDFDLLHALAECRNQTHWKNIERQARVIPKP